MIFFSLFAFFLYLAVTAVLSVLQLFLSRKKSKWPGLILPTLFILFSIVWTFTNYINYFPNKDVPIEQSTINYDENGNIVEKIEKIDENNYIQETRTSYSSGLIISGSGIIFIFTAMNIPTIIFLFIYGISREKMRSKLEIQKMAIQDLN